jgi:hypothetical protein
MGARIRSKAASKAPRPAAAPKSIAITAISLPPDTLELVRMVAIRRQAQVGHGRPSASAVLAELVERHRKDLEAELR